MAYWESEHTAGINSFARLNQRVQFPEMTNTQLADLLEEAAHRLRRHSAMYTSQETSCLSIEQASTRLGISPWTVREKARLGKIQATKVHGEWQITEGAVETYLAVQRGIGANKSLKSAMQRGRSIL